MKERMNALAGLCVVLLVVCMTVQAEPSGGTESDKRAKELPDSGLLAVQGVAIHRELNLPAPWGGPGAPLVGGLSNPSPESWGFRVENVSDTSYRVSLEFIEIGEGTRRLQTRGYNYRLRPGDSRDAEVRRSRTARAAALVLRSWRKLDQ